MERILKSLLDHLLRDYVTFSKETGDGTFKASFSSSGILLHDIEFNIDKLKTIFPDVKSARAETLEIKVPWSMLGTTSKSLEVHVSSIRLVLTKKPQEVAGSNEDDTPGSLHDDKSANPDDEKEKSNLLYPRGLRSGVYSGIVGYLLEMSVFLADIQITYEFDQDNFASFSIDWIEVTSNGIDAFNGVVVNRPSDWIDKEVLMNGIKFAWAIRAQPALQIRLTHANLNVVMPKSLILRSEENLRHLVLPVAISLGDILCDANISQFWPIMQVMLSQKTEDPDSDVWSKLIYSLSLFFKNSSIEDPRGAHTLEGGMSQADDSSWKLEIGVTLSVLCLRAYVSNKLSSRCLSFDASLIAANIEIDHCGGCDASLWIEGISLGHIFCDPLQWESGKGDFAPFLNISPAKADGGKNDLTKMHGLVLHLVWSMKEISLQIDSTLGRLHCINTLLGFDNFANSVRMLLDEFPQESHIIPHGYSSREGRISRSCKVSCRFQESLVGINCEESQVLGWVQGSRIEVSVCMDNHSKIQFNSSGEIYLFFEERDLDQQCNTLKLNSTNFHLHGSTGAFVLNFGPVKVKLNNVQIDKIINALVQWNNKHICLAFGGLENFEFNLDSLETSGNKLLIYDQGAFRLGISASALLQSKLYSCKVSVETNISWVPTNRVHVSAWMLNLLVSKSEESMVGCLDIMQGSCSSFTIDNRQEKEVNGTSITIGSVVIQSQLSSMQQFTEAVVATTSPFCSLIAQKSDSIRLQERDSSSISRLDEFNLDFVSISFVDVCLNAEQMLHIWVSCVQGSNHRSSNSSDVFTVEVFNLGIESEMKNSDKVCSTGNFLRLDRDDHGCAIVVQHTKENMNENMTSISVLIEPISLHFNAHLNGLLFQTLLAIKDAQDFLSLLLENGDVNRSAMKNRSLKIRCQVITIKLSDLHKENIIVGKFHLVNCGIVTRGICHGRPWLDDTLWLLMDMKVLLESSYCSVTLRSADMEQFEKIISASSWSFSFLKWPLGDFKSVDLNCLVMYIHGSIGTWKSVLDMIDNQKIQIHYKKRTPHKQPAKSCSISVEIDDIRGHPTIEGCSCSFEDFMAIRVIQGNHPDQQIIWWRYYTRRLVHSIRLQFPIGIDVQTGANISLQYFRDGETEKIDGNLGANGELLLSEKPASCSYDWGLEWSSREIPFCAAEVLNMLFVKSNFGHIPRVACRTSGLYTGVTADTCFKIRVKHMSIDLVALGWPEHPHPGIVNHSLMNVLLGVKASDISLSGEVGHCLTLSISCSLNGDITDPITFRPHEFFSGESLRVEYVQWKDRNSIETASSSQSANSLTHTERLDKHRASEEATFHQVSVHSREDVLITFSDSFLLVGQQWMSMLMSDSFNRYPVRIKNTCRVSLIMKEKYGSKEVTVIDSEEIGILLEQSKSLLFRPESSLEWSHPIEVLSCHAELLEIGQHRLAAEVRFCEGSFLLTICCGIVVINRTCRPLHLFIISNGNKSRVMLDPGSECGTEHVELSLSIETETGWTQKVEVREQLLCPRRDNIKELKAHGSDFALLLGVQKCSKSGKVIANIHSPVSLTNRLSQCLLLKDLRGQFLRLQSGSSVDLPLPSHGGQVVKIGICDETSCHEGGFIGVVCPPYGVVDDFSGQIEEKDCAYVPPPGQSIGIRIPQASDLDIKVLLACHLREYGTLSLELCPRVTLYNRTNLYLHFQVDREEYTLSPSSELGVSNKANMLSCRCEGDIDGRKFPSFLWRGCDASFSQERVIDFVCSDLKSLRLYLQIERSPSGGSIEIRPFYYISNDTDYIFHDDYNSYKGNKPIPLLGVMETETNRIRLARTKRRPNGGFLTVDYVMLDSGGIFTPETGIAGDFTYSSVVKPSHIHFIFRRADRSFEIVNKTEEDFTLSFADSAENLLRTIYLPKRQCHSIQMYGIEFTFQITVKDTSIYFPISELRQGCAFPFHNKYILHMTSKNSCAFISAGLFRSNIEELLLELPSIIIECSSHSGNGTKIRTRIGSTTVNASLGSLCQNLALNLRTTDWHTSIHSLGGSKPLGKSKGRAFFELSAEIFVEKHALVAQRINVVLSETHFNLDDTIIRYVIDFLRLFPRDERISPGLKEELLQELSELQESKFLVEEFTMNEVRATCDIHVSDSFSLPLSIDANRAPISLPAISCERETSWREIIRIFETNAYDGLVVSIPSAIGSLQLLFDPLGLVRSLRRGLFDMVHLPLLGIQEKSLSHFIAGLHQGSASLLKELSGWSISSIRGFSAALMKIVSNSQKSSQYSTLIDGGSDETRHGRKIIYGSHLLPNSIFQFCSSNSEILLHREMIEAKVSILRDMNFAFRIEDPVVILLERYVAVLANCGCTASFLIALDDTDWDLDPLTRRLSMKTSGCYSFADLSCAKTACVELFFDYVNFDLFRLTFEELHNHKNKYM